LAVEALEVLRKEVLVLIHHLALCLFVVAVAEAVAEVAQGRVQTVGQEQMQEDLALLVLQQFSQTFREQVVVAHQVVAETPQRGVGVLAAALEDRLVLLDTMEQI